MKKVPHEFDRLLNAEAEYHCSRQIFERKYGKRLKEAYDLLNNNGGYIGWSFIRHSDPEKSYFFLKGQGNYSYAEEEYEEILASDIFYNWENWKDGMKKKEERRREKEERERKKRDREREERERKEYESLKNRFGDRNINTGNFWQ